MRFLRKKSAVGMIGAALAAVLVFFPLAQIFAASEESGELERAILAVKRVVAIPETLLDFNYYLGENEESGNQEYSFRWSGEKGGRQVSASVENGKMTSYSSYSYDSDALKGIGAVSRDAAQETAESWLAAVDGVMAAKMKPAEYAEAGNIDRWNFSFVFRESDVPAEFVTALVSVDKRSGEVVSYNWQGLNETPKYPAVNDIVGKDASKTAFLDEGGVRLIYFAWYDGVAKTSEVFSAYTLREGRLAVDAKTGKAETLASPGISYRNAVDAESVTSGGAGRQELSEAELISIAQTEKLISKDAAVDALKKLFPKLAAYNATYSQLSKDYRDDEKYIWSISFDNMSGAVDARTGEILSYSDYSDDSRALGAGKQISANEALAAAKAAAERISPEKFGQCEEYYPIETYYPLETYEAREKFPGRGNTSYSFNFERVVNGLHFPDNGVRIEINMSGDVVSYSCAWSDNLVFPAAGGAMTASEAFDIFDRESGWNLKYAKRASEDAAVIAAWHWESEPAYLLDPKSGAKLNYDGKLWKESAAASYDDIGGHWAESVIKLLAENGYYIEGSSFRPKAPITQEKFLRYLLSPQQLYYDQDAFYRMLEESGMVRADEKAPDAELTRNEAAKFIVRHLGQQRAGEHAEIFLSPYIDAQADGYAGYTAIVYALSVMKGYDGGDFNGTKLMTNAEAAVTIYNTLQAQ
ncbi:MAG: S-layer homology domain-containing protein [Clostridiales Family XIII bacterium]|jgi:hypothetical protein|nr:S-layer homology domain-containing protein [Clostridiales Family XIII bacterium]